MRRKRGSRFIALLLACVLVLGTTSTAVFAEDPETDEYITIPVVEEEVSEDSDDAEEFNDFSVEDETVDIVDESSVELEISDVADEFNDEVEIETEISMFAEESEIMYYSDDPEYEENYGIMTLKAFTGSGTKDDPWLIGDSDENDVTAYLSEDGTTLYIQGNGAMDNGGTGGTYWAWNSVKTGITKAVVEDGVTNIGAYCFFGCTALIDITIPDSVTSVGNCAFGRCEILPSITIPSTVTSIGSSAFDRCYELKEVKIPNGVKEISASTFTQCTGLISVEIPESVTSIGSEAFNSCSALENISLPENLVELGNGAFLSCTSLTEVKLPSGIKEVPKDTFNGCTKLTEVSIDTDGTITAVGNGAFRDCTSLERVFDLSQVDDDGAGTYMFYDCSSLIGPVDLSSMTIIPQYAFDGCSSLTGVTFGDELTKINTYAFSGCKALTELHFPETLIDIGNYAFNGCSHVAYMELPSNLETIGNYSFWNCWLNGTSMQATTTVDVGAAVYSMNSGDITTANVEQSYAGNTLVIPDSVTSIGKNAFEYSYIDVFVVGSNVTEIDASAFAGYEVEAVIFDNLMQSVTISNLSSLNGRLDDSHSNQDVSVVYLLGADAVYLDGVNGDDSNDGTEKTPVKTFAKAKELADKEGISVISIENTVTVTGEENWEGGTDGLTVVRNDNCTAGLVEVKGENAKLTLSNITINGRNISSTSSMIKVTEGGTLNVTDGTVIEKFQRSSSGNQYLYNDQGAVLVRNGILNMTGGEIRDNSGGRCGGAVALIGEYANETAVMNFSGGIISDSSATNGGGIYMYGDATLSMTGGTVTGNTASRCGGGMFVGPDAVAEISAGYITNNKVTGTGSYGGGGIYVESSESAKRDDGSARVPGHLYLYNVEISDNYFSRTGSGNGVYLSTIACCETGNVEINITKGAVIHDNSEGQTIYVNRDVEKSSGSVTLPAIMLGGGAYNWVDSISGNPIDLDNLFDNGSSIVHAITRVSTEDGTVTGIGRCTTFITGNYAYDEGSAIGTNGNVTIGYNDGDAEISIEKKWNEADSSDVIPDEIIVYVYATDGYGVTTCIGSITLNEVNGWKTTITELPKYDSDGYEYTYTVQEETVDGWISETEGGKTETSTPVNGGYDEDDDKTASYEFIITNSAVRDLSISKEVSGSNDTDSYEFEVSLSKNNIPYTEDVSVTYSSEDNENWEDIITFENGKGYVTIQSGEKATLDISYGMDWSVSEITTADSTLIYVDGDMVEKPAEKTDAYAAVGTIHDSTQVVFINSYREYFPIDEEIVTDTDDIFNRSAWIKEESVNEYNSIEIEMTTNLPVITAFDLENGEFTMNFHEVLDSQLRLDEIDSDFSLYIAEQKIDHDYYTVTIASDSEVSPASIRTFSNFGNEIIDGCTFHVDVNLTALYNDGIVTEDMLDGNTEITIFFFADLEGTGLNGSYKSTIWYDIYDGDEWLYTSNIDVVEVYTYEIEIMKYDIDTEDPLSGAVFGIYYDAECEEPVYRYVGQGFDESEKTAYTVISGEDGMAIFYGLANGTFYIKELSAPEGYILSDEIIKVELNGDTVNEYAYEFGFANSPEIPEIVPHDLEYPDEDEELPDEGEVLPNDDEGSPEATPVVSNSADTGDSSSPLLWIMMLCSSAACLAALAFVSVRSRVRK